MRPSGLFPVGISDLEYAGHGVSLTPDVVLDPAKHVVGRLFYPCDPKQPAGSGAVKGRTPWLPAWAYATGYVKFLFFLAKGLKVAILEQILRVGVYAMGRTLIQPFHRGAGLARSDRPFPVILFSHGLAGTRNTYSLFCSELASHGYVVLAIEHACGTASTCKLAGAGGFRYYAGLGQEEAKWAKQRYRTAEIRTAARVLRCLASGDDIGGSISLSGVRNPSAVLKGALDVARFALAGHSFGGASIGDLCAADPSFVCAVALDPWWFGMVPESPALTQWGTSSPLLILGSHDWNTPREGQDLKCGGELQQALMRAANPRRVERKQLGGGAMLLVLKNSTHDSYNDVLALFSTRLGWFLRRMNFTMKLDPVTGMAAITECAAMFLATHMPTPAAAVPDPVDTPAASKAFPNGMAQVDSDWSLVSGASDDGEEPEIPSEATRTRSNPPSAPHKAQHADHSATLDPAEGTEAAATVGGGSAQLRYSTRADAHQLDRARHADEVGRLAGDGVAEPATQVEDATIPISHEEEVEYRSKFGELIHILKVTA